MQVGLLILFDRFERIQNLPLDLHIFGAAPNVAPIGQCLNMAERIRPTLKQLRWCQINLLSHQ